MYFVVVKFIIADGYGEMFLKRVRQQAHDSLSKEPDCHVFDVCVDLNDDHRIMLYEAYSNQAAFDFHLQSSHFREFDRDVKEMVLDKTISFYLRS